MKLNPREIILKPIISEASYDKIENNVYTFEVHPQANKIEIRNAVQSIFNVSVTNVNTLTVHPKKKRLRYKEGLTAQRKKAFVTLAEGDKIEVFGN